ncbi:PKD domain-containing protein [Longitalea luteola]|uniref:PKD domain-containing protein n=1 Tax=Longitalea luteola TaxID=2812563 RepID=UPI001A973B01|nr:PKD domain-containing protein [Longitalea luteola]
MFSLIFSSCRKNDVLKKEPPQFTIEQIKHVEYTLFPVRYTLHFINTSDSSAEISYRWHFGDGNTAEGYNAYHAYLKPGNYTVWLTKYKGNRAVDSASRDLKVDAIPILIKHSGEGGTFPGGIARYGDKIYLASWKSVSNSNFVPVEGVLTQYDTLWRAQWTRTFPREEGEIKQMNITANGDVLLSFVAFEGKSKLYRIDGKGNTKWSWKNTHENLWVNTATEDNQGNIIIMGYGMLWKGITIQLNATGNENWKYFWPDAVMSNCAKPVILGDGYVFSGSKNGSCKPRCDSVQVAKLSLDGRMVWSSTFPFANYSDYTYYSDVFTVLDQSNHLQVFYSQSYSYYTFDLNGKYLGNHAFEVGFIPRDVLVNKKGSLLVLGTTTRDYERARLLEFKADGGTGWVYNIFKTIVDLKLVEYPDDIRPTSMYLTSDNVAMMTGRFKWNDPVFPSVAHYAGIFVCQVDADGKLY